MICLNDSVLCPNSLALTREGRLTTSWEVQDLLWRGLSLSLQIFHLPGSPPSPWSVSVKDPSSQWWSPLLTCVPWYQGSAAKMLRAKVCFCLWVCVLIAYSCPIHWVPMDCSLPDFCVYGIFQVRILLRWRHYPIVIVTSLVGNFYFATTASIIQTFF